MKPVRRIKRDGSAAFTRKARRLHLAVINVTSCEMEDPSGSTCQMQMAVDSKGIHGFYNFDDEVSHWRKMPTDSFDLYVEEVYQELAGV